MLHLKDDFAAGRPISQVPASWFNKVAKFINNLVGGRFIRITKSETGVQVIDVTEDVQPTSKEVGDSPTDGQDKATEPLGTESDGTTWSWTAGGANGLKLDVYCRCVGGEDEHRMERATLTFSKDGLLVSAVKTNEQKVIYA